MLLHLWGSDYNVEKLRIDKWLWAARFYKTRALAAKAVQGGRVKVNGERVKPARQIVIGDALSISRWDDMQIHVVDLSDKRGPAKVAQTLYQETQASAQDRETQQQVRKINKQAAPDYGRRPDKRGRRQISDLLGKRQEPVKGKNNASS